MTSILQQVIRRRKISPSRSWQAVQLNIPPGKGMPFKNSKDINKLTLLTALLKVLHGGDM